MSTASTEPAPRIDRVVSGEARDGLDRIRGSEVLKSGGVNLIGLDAIRRQLGERWEAKRGRVWEHVERDLTRRLSPHDMFYRLDDVNYLIAMPLGSQFMAQAACMSILQDVLKFFLGESNMRDVVVRTVTSVDGGEVVSEAVDPAAIVEAQTRAASAAPLPEQEQTEVEWKPPLVGRTHALSLQTEARRTVDLKMGVEAVWNLRRGLITSFVLERAISPPLSDPHDVLKVDSAVIAYAAELLKEHRDRGGKLTLHVPISYASVAALRAREQLLKSAASVREIMRTTVLFEIADLDPGVPPSRLIEVSALLRPFCLGVLARVKPTKKALAAVRGCGLQGVVLEAQNLGRNPTETSAFMKAFADIAHGSAPNLIVHGLSGGHMIDVAAVAGMTHASTWPQLKFETVIDAA